MVGGHFGLSGLSEFALLPSKTLFFVFSAELESSLYLIVLLLGTVLFVSRLSGRIQNVLPKKRQEVFYQSSKLSTADYDFVFWVSYCSNQDIFQREIRVACPLES